VKDNVTSPGEVATVLPGAGLALANRAWASAAVAPIKKTADSVAKPSAKFLIMFLLEELTR
jgi:hypothetical protein